MIHLRLDKLSSIQDAQIALQKAIRVEFGTLPPYLYSLYSIKPGTNDPAVQRIKSVVLQEMIHMCLACNILNALGGDPVLTPPKYPGTLGDIGPDGKPLTIYLYPFSQQAMSQAMAIEQPVDPPNFPIKLAPSLAAAPQALTIGQFYDAIDAFLKTLPAGDWTAGRNQITDDQFFAGQIFAVNGYDDAHVAISNIVSEGEGAKKDPLDFQHQIAHYYRFGEIFHNKVLTKDSTAADGYAWGPEPLGIDWTGVYSAITDPGSHDFSNDPKAARDAQDACNTAYAAMVGALQEAVTGTEGALGDAVRSMFDLRMAALHAFTVPLADPKTVAGPAFLDKNS